MIVRIPSQCIQISDQVVHFKYITSFFVNYTSIKIDKNKEGERECWGRKVGRERKGRETERGQTQGSGGRKKEKERERHINS